MKSFEDFSCLSNLKEYLKICESIDADCSCMVDEFDENDYVESCNFHSGDLDFCGCCSNDHDENKLVANDHDSEDCDLNEHSMVVQVTDLIQRKPSSQRLRKIERQIEKNCRRTVEDVANRKIELVHKENDQVNIPSSTRRNVEDIQSKSDSHINDFKNFEFVHKPRFENLANNFAFYSYVSNVSIEKSYLERIFSSCYQEGLCQPRKFMINIIDLNTRKGNSNMNNVLAERASHDYDINHTDQLSFLLCEEEVRKDNYTRIRLFIYF